MRRFIFVCVCIFVILHKLCYIIVTGLKQKSTEPLVGLAQRIHDGDVHALAGHINKFFQQVAADLRPLSDHTIPPTSDVLQSEFVIELSAVERKLSQINVYKAPGQIGRASCRERV